MKIETELFVLNCPQYKDHIIEIQNYRNCCYNFRGECKFVSPPFKYISNETGRIRYLKRH